MQSSDILDHSEQPSYILSICGGNTRVDAGQLLIND